MLPHKRLVTQQPAALPAVRYVSAKRSAKIARIARIARIAKSAKSAKIAKIAKSVQRLHVLKLHVTGQTPDALPPNQDAGIILAASAPNKKASQRLSYTQSGVEHYQ